MKIVLNNAGKRFNREWIFRNLSYQFSANNSYAITGPNGSGKSTLLQVLSASLILNEGSCDWFWHDENINHENVHEHVSFAAPYLELIEEMTATEFLKFHSTFKKFINNISVENILDTVELSSAAKKQIRFYSSGMKQRLKLAQTIFSDVPFVLLDEPCTNLDKAGFDLYYELIETFCRNRLLIVSSNDVNEYKVCNQQINIQKFK